ncbi:hypothetical protein AB1N83_004332 [Pleurotus pulmonarius]
MVSQNIVADRWESAGTSRQPHYTSTPTFEFEAQVQPEPRLQYPTSQDTYSSFGVSSNQRISDNLSELEERHRVVQEEQERLYQSQMTLLAGVQTVCQELAEENNRLKDARAEFEENQRDMSSQMEQTQNLLETCQYDITDLRATNSSLERRIYSLEREKNELQTKYDELLASAQNYKHEEEDKTSPVVDMKNDWIVMQAINKNLLERNNVLQRQCMKYSKRKRSKQ